MVEESLHRDGRLLVCVQPPFFFHDVADVFGAEVPIKPGLDLRNKSVLLLERLGAKQSYEHLGRDLRLDHVDHFVLVLSLVLHWLPFVALQYWKHFLIFSFVFV